MSRQAKSERVSVTPATLRRLEAAGLDGLIAPGDVIEAMTLAWDELAEAERQEYLRRLSESRKSAQAASETAAA